MELQDQQAVQLRLFAAGPHFSPQQVVLQAQLDPVGRPELMGPINLHLLHQPRPQVVGMVQQVPVAVLGIGFGHMARMLIYSSLLMVEVVVMVELVVMGPGLTEGVQVGAAEPGILLQIAFAAVVALVGMALRGGQAALLTELV